MIAVVPRAGTWIETLLYLYPGFLFVLSFPVRERGLKLSICREFDVNEESFPVRERGLKHPSCQPVPYIEKSFPVRERGLKPQPVIRCHAAPVVVPRAGTWIETACSDR